jgi:hypothetical protein
LVNAAKHYDNGFLLLKEDQSLASPLAVVFYEEYEDLNALNQTLTENAEDIQCAVSNTTLSIPTFAFGQSQHPKLWDYADNINTIDFLNSIA